jgi:hypothetical protein
MSSPEPCGWSCGTRSQLQAHGCCIVTLRCISRMEWPWPFSMVWILGLKYHLSMRTEAEASLARRQARPHPQKPRWRWRWIECPHRALNRPGSSTWRCWAAQLQCSHGCSPVHSPGPRRHQRQTSQAKSSQAKRNRAKTRNRRRAMYGKWHVVAVPSSLQLSGQISMSVTIRFGGACDCQAKAIR